MGAWDRGLDVEQGGGSRLGKMGGCWMSFRRGMGGRTLGGDVEWAVMLGDVRWLCLRKEVGWLGGV